MPLYFQLAQHFESAIRSGALKVGARLENEVQLAEMLGLSRPTVRAAFLYLANKGLVYASAAPVPWRRKSGSTATSS